MIQRIQKKIYREFVGLIPFNKMGDNFIHYLNFILSHKRLPNKKFFNDYLFRIKTGDEILNVLRQYTSDKEFVKLYIKDKIGDNFNVKTKAILKSEYEILNYDFSVGDVVKPTHASGFVYFVKKKILTKNM